MPLRGADVNRSRPMVRRRASRDQPAASIAEECPCDVVYLAPAALHQAEIHERLGNHAEAIRHYERFVEFWSDSDAILQTQVEAAEARLASVLGSLRRDVQYLVR